MDTYAPTINSNSQGYGRFFLSFGNKTAAGEISDQPASYKAWYMEGSVHILGTNPGTGISLYDVNGRLIHQTQSDTQQLLSIPLSKSHNGVYIVKIMDAKGPVVLKVPVMN